MILSIREIPEGYSKIAQECALESIKKDLPPMVGKIICQGEINRIGDDIFANLELEGTFVLQCARCLENYNSKIKANVHIVIKETVGQHGKAEGQEQIDFFYDASYNTLDISSAFYDEIITEIPIMPLCSENCKGIEISDRNINVDFSKKKKNGDEIDPRWEALRKLKE